MGSLTPKGVPFPVGEDDPAGHTQMEAIATWVDGYPGIASLVEADRDALTVKWVGMTIYNLDAGRLEVWDGVGWAGVAAGATGGIPSMTTAERDALPVDERYVGMVIWNETTKQHEWCYTADYWTSLSRIPWVTSMSPGPVNPAHNDARGVAVYDSVNKRFMTYMGPAAFPWQPAFPLGHYARNLLTNAPSFYNDAGVQVWDSTYKVPATYDGAAWSYGSPMAAMTTAQRDAIAAADRRPGVTVWNSTTARSEMWNGSAWVPVGTGAIANVAWGEVGFGEMISDLAAISDNTLKDLGCVANFTAVAGRRYVAEWAALAYSTAADDVAVFYAYMGGITGTNVGQARIINPKVGGTNNYQTYFASRPFNVAPAPGPVAVHLAFQRSSVSTGAWNVNASPGAQSTYLRIMDVGPIVRT